MGGRGRATTKTATPEAHAYGHGGLVHGEGFGAREQVGGVIRSLESELAELNDQYLRTITDLRQPVEGADETTMAARSLRTAPGDDQTPVWVTSGGPLVASAQSGTRVGFSVAWGVANTSALPAVVGVMRGGFWNGGKITTSDHRCSTGNGFDLKCNLGPLAVGRWAQAVRFEVAVAQDAAQGSYLPYYIGGSTGFEEGPESFGRLRVGS